MKHKILTKLSIILILFLSLTAYSQTVKNKTQTDKKERSDVEKFTDEFIKELEIKKDLGQISEKFFVTDFKNRFGRDREPSGVTSAIFNKLSETERYECNVAVFNFYYLGLMHSFGKVSFRDESENESGFEETNETGDPESTENLFPSHIIAMIRNSKILNAYFLEREDEEGFGIAFEIKNAAELRDFINDSKNIIHAQRSFLNERSSEQKSKYEENIKLLRKSGNLYESEICLKDCKDFPEKTQIFNLRDYPLCFKIIRENGALRIFDLEICAFD